MRMIRPLSARGIHIGTDRLYAFVPSKGDQRVDAEIRGRQKRSAAEVDAGGDRPDRAAEFHRR